MKKIYFLLFFIVLAATAVAQPPEIYFGGIGDGFHFETFTADSTIYNAGPSDGFAAVMYLNPSSIFVSSASDGFSFSTYSNTNLLSLGGIIAKTNYTSLIKQNEAFLSHKNSN